MSCALGWGTVVSRCNQVYYEVAKLLLGAGAAVDQANTNGLSPLFVTSLKGHRECVQLLLGAGITPRRVASLRGPRECAQRLLGAALHLGVEVGLGLCARLLREQQVVIDSGERVVAYRSLRRAGHDMIPHAKKMCTDPSPQVRREIALSLRDIPAEKTKEIFVELAKRCNRTCCR